MDSETEYFSNSVVRRYNNLYQQAHDFVDIESFSSAIEFIEDILHNKKCPPTFRVRFMVLCSVCFDDWDKRSAYLDKAENLWQSLRRNNPIGRNETTDEILDELRDDIDTTRRDGEKLFPRPDWREQIGDEQEQAAPEELSKTFQPSEVKCKQESPASMIEQATNACESQIKRNPNTGTKDKYVKIKESDWEAVKAKYEALNVKHEALNAEHEAMNARLQKLEPAVEAIVASQSSKQVKSSIDKATDKEGPSSPHSLALRPFAQVSPLNKILRMRLTFHSPQSLR
jgi:hypothetical protein